MDLELSSNSSDEDNAEANRPRALPVQQVDTKPFLTTAKLARHNRDNSSSLQALLSPRVDMSLVSTAPDFLSLNPLSLKGGQSNRSCSEIQCNLRNIRSNAGSMPQSGRRRSVSYDFAANKPANTNSSMAPSLFTTTDLLSTDRKALSTRAKTLLQEVAPGALQVPGPATPRTAYMQDSVNRHSTSTTRVLSPVHPKSPPALQIEKIVDMYHDGWKIGVRQLGRAVSDMAPRELPEPDSHEEVDFSREFDLDPITTVHRLLALRFSHTRLAQLLHRMAVGTSQSSPLSPHLNPHKLAVVLTHYLSIPGKWDILK